MGPGMPHVQIPRPSGQVKLSGGGIKAFFASLCTLLWQVAHSGVLASSDAGHSDEEKWIDPEMGLRCLLSLVQFMATLVEKMMNHQVWRYPIFGQNEMWFHSLSKPRIVGHVFINLQSNQQPPNSTTWPIAINWHFQLG